MSCSRAANGGCAVTNEAFKEPAPLPAHARESLRSPAVPHPDRDADHDRCHLSALDIPGFLVSLTHILVSLFLSLLIGLLARGKWRSWTILVVSVLGIYWLQPAIPIRNLDFWFPTLSLGLTVLVWYMIISKDTPRDRNDPVTFFIVLGLILTIGLTRYLGNGTLLTPTRPPLPGNIALALILLMSLSLLVTKLREKGLSLAPFGVSLILMCFLILKSGPLAEAASRGLRSLSGQSPDFASATELQWLGFSYIAFRLLHTLRDHALGRLPPLTLREFVSYVLFFPALPAGPIDRVERFQKDLNSSTKLTTEIGLEGGIRIVIGVFKKFVLADGLATFALSAVSASQIQSAGWLWVMLYAYAFRIYLDFSGYTDVAIGSGLLMGVRLPENFDRPYFKPNIAAFWNSWHITLAQWFRAYFFNPLTRALRAGRVKLPTGAIIFIGQISTMALIGLWHGIAWNFLLWGLWHGLGLFLHNRWVDLQRSRSGWFPQRLLQSRALRILSVLFTFHFVLLGWIPFVIPDVQQALDVFLRLFGA
jgi:alginate O-acetyltransferase complex protein AlgI